MVEQMAESFRDINQFEREERLMMATENDVSVSFGKFDNDLLSWDRWSSFSQNKYLEEVEKCSTPGSVASKKAYFEAHYKKIAARNAAAELLEQEQQLQIDSATSNCPSNGKKVQDDEESFEFDSGHQIQTQGFRKCQLSLIHADESNQLDTGGVDCQVSICQVTKEEAQSQQHDFSAGNFGESVSVRGNETPEEKLKTEIEELETSISVQGENQQQNQEHNLRSKEMQSQQHNLNTKGLEAPVSVQLENPLERSKAQNEEVVLIEEKNCYDEAHAEVEEVRLLIKEENQSVHSPPSSIKEEDISKRSQEGVEVETHSGRTQPETSTGHVEKVETTKMKPRKEPRKVHPRVPATKEKIPAKTMRKLAAPKTKTAQSPVSKASKPSPSSPAISTTSRIPTRKDSSQSLLKNKQHFPADNKRSTSSTSLHMSLNAPPVKSDSSFLNTTRRSLIMEQMGDKEIIKRAFKSFRNTYGTPLSNGEGTSSTFQQLSERTPSSTVLQKDKKGTGMSLGKASPHTKQVAARPISPSASPVRPAGAKQTITKASTASPFRLQSDVKAEKHKEVMKRRDGKLKATELDKTTRLRSKSKDVAHQTTSWK